MKCAFLKFTSSLKELRSGREVGVPACELRISPVIPATLTLANVDELDGCELGNSGTDQCTDRQRALEGGLLEGEDEIEGERKGTRRARSGKWSH
jgi:hypothetical protein